MQAVFITEFFPTLFCVFEIGVFFSNMTYIKSRLLVYYNPVTVIINKQGILATYDVVIRKM